MDQPRTALITGASSGIGSAIAQAMAREGYDLALADIDTKLLKDVMAEPEIASRKTVAIRVDLRVPAEITAALDQARAALGPIGVLVNNAGRPLTKPSIEITPEEWDDTVDINLKGAFLLSTAFGRGCIEGHHAGAIVSLASTHGVVAIPERAVYGITKAGLIQMTRMLAIEWASRNIRVNAVAPTTVLTPSRQKMLSDPQRRADMLARIPTGRFATPEEVAAAVVYLVGPGAASVTGHTRMVDGGLTAY
jgi:NAD(P)-dependent dehydrogenase (short-subunit alcohol dehydrogenase family)